jgi:hypothetical protein
MLQQIVATFVSITLKLVSSVLRSISVALELLDGTSTWSNRIAVPGNPSPYFHYWIRQPQPCPVSIAPAVAP